MFDMQSMSFMSEWGDFKAPHFIEDQPENVVFEVVRFRGRTEVLAANVIPESGNELCYGVATDAHKDGNLPYIVELIVPADLHPGFYVIEGMKGCPDEDSATDIQFRRLREADYGEVDRWLTAGIILR